MTPTFTKRAGRGLVLAGLIATAVACTGSDSDSADPDGGDPGDCITVDMAVSSEKITLLTELATDFNTSEDATTGDDCIFVRPARKASGTAANLIVAGWPEPELNGEPPVIWSPAASGWAGIVNERAGTNRARPAPHSC